jgi:tetratricopeptide (TPR) repeat protein
LDTIGWIYYKLGKTKKAETYIRKSLDEDSTSAEVFDHLGDVYNQLNKREKAEEMWNKALELDPDNQEIKTKLQKGTL